MVRCALLLVVAFAVALAPGREAPAEALSCLAPSGPVPSAFATHPVVIEGVALSGPATELHGELGSPARFFVTRWRRGSGPRVVRVATAVQLGVGPVFGHLAGYFSPRAGTVARLFADRVRGGVVRPNPCVFGDQGGPVGRVLRDVAGSQLRVGPAGRPWRARVQRGPAGLHCVVLHPEGRHTGGGKECDAGRPLLAVRQEGRYDRASGRPTGAWSTAIVLAGPGVAAAELRTPDGPLVVRPRRAGDAMLVVLGGRVDPAEVRARVAMVDGSVRWMQPVGYPSALTPDPEQGRPWRSRIDTGPGVSLFGRSESRTCVGIDQLPPRAGDVLPGLEGDVACARDLRATPYFFAARALAPWQEPGQPPPPPARTAVFGAAAPSVAAIIVRDPSGGERRLTRGRGGQFATVYPASVAPRDLVLEVVFADGTSVIHRGRSGANLD